MVIRGYLSGHAWREYKLGKELCGVELPNGMKRKLIPSPIITPTSKAQVGHDMDLSKDDIIQSGLINKSDYNKLEEFYALFETGTNYAKSRGLLLVDTKYEFAVYNEKIHIIDEILTQIHQDTFMRRSYEDLQSRGEKQRQLSKNFLENDLLKMVFKEMKAKSS